MKIALITIGDEILTGFTTNSNAAWIGQEILKIGANINVQVTVSDNEKDIKRYLDYFSSENYSHIIVTGGLGPTHDDVTQSAFFDFFSSKAIFDASYWEQLKSRFAKRNILIPEKNRNQAVKPHNGDIIDNQLGSARGLYFSRPKNKYFALPGVPAEMKAMMINTVIPLIVQDYSKNSYIKTINTIGLGESAIAEKLEDVIKKYSPKIKIAFLPQLGRVDIRLFSENKLFLAQITDEIEKILNRNIYGYDDDTIETAVAKLLIEKKYTIATAESCTGGLLAHRLTNVAGSSKYMLGGVVCYSNSVKIEQVGAKQKTIMDYGAVSEQTARELALGIQNKFNSNVGIGITGIAGPDGGTKEKPVGLAYIGLIINDEELVKKFQFVTNRKANKLLSSQTALNLLRLKLMQ